MRPAWPTRSTGSGSATKIHDQIVSDARLNFPSIKKTRARARYGVLENLSKPYIQRKFRRLAGIGRLGTRRPLKRPSLIAAYVKRFKEYTRRHDRVDAPSKDTSGEVRSRCASSVFGASGNPGGAAEKVNYRGLVMPSALTPSLAGRSRHRARCARAGTAESPPSSPLRKKI